MGVACSWLLIGRKVRQQRWLVQQPTEGAVEDLGAPAWGCGSVKRPASYLQINTDEDEEENRRTAGEFVEERNPTTEERDLLRESG
jgi:hypothetical protein